MKPGRTRSGPAAHLKKSEGTNRLVSPSELASDISDVLEGVLIHQRQRWGTLLGHRAQYEGWWKAEFASAIESWAWTWGAPGVFGVIPERKPRDYGLGVSRQTADLVILPWNPAKRKAVEGEFPRLWLELKERGTWWRTSAEAANMGLRNDIRKWREVPWTRGDAVLACQIVVHDGDEETTLPAEWEESLDSVAIECQRFRQKPMIVGYPLGDGRVRWARLDIFSVHLGS